MNLKNLLIFLSLIINTFSCSSTKEKPQGNFDFNTQKIHHGWTIITGPKKTESYQSDLNSLSRGEALFQKHCVSCHGLQGKGDGPESKKLKRKPADLTQLAQIHEDSFFVIQISQGKDSMPSWDDLLTPQETNDIGHYVKSLVKK